MSGGSSARGGRLPEVVLRLRDGQTPSSAGARAAIRGRLVNLERFAGQHSAGRAAAERVLRRGLR